MKAKRRKRQSVSGNQWEKDEEEDKKKIESIRKKTVHVKTASPN